MDKKKTTSTVGIEFEWIIKTQLNADRYIEWKDHTEKARFSGTILNKEAYKLEVHGGKKNKSLQLENNNFWPFST